ncbi:predicted protein [Nematostella vectensis]|uniref:Potassium channel n=2 Tax=Nematostella vectensis TaxID=45351 RepID=A7RL21_NEMVE|nr:predicted protein [Nematostella vectensis]|eukprot:XP_001639924.1 predicted protein [Nematostella vectensis]
MLHQLYSEGSCSRYSPTQRQKKRPSSSTLSELKLPHPRPSINHRSCSFAESTRKEKKVRVNVSGKKYELSLLELSKYPDSLLSNPLLSGKYYDNKTKEYFFDRSRVVFDCIYNFYHSKGEISLPKDYPEQLLADELHFFGLFTHLKEKDKENLVLPTLLEKEIPSPKNMLQRKIWQMLENPESSLHATIICITTLLVILLSIAVLCVDTLLIPPVPPGEEKAGQTNSTINWTAGVTPEQEHLNDILFTIETCCVAYFTTELVLRFLVSPTKLLFFRSVLNLIDVLAVAPYYAMLIIEVGLSSTGAAALRIFRLSRVFRVLKVSRYVSGMEVLTKTMRAAIYDVWMVVFLTMIGTTLFASCVYYFEQFGDPDTDFESIPMSIWWAIITISTVGYGDLAPRTLCELNLIIILDLVGLCN